MASTSVKISLTHAQVRKAAFAEAGLRGADFGHRKAVQRHANKKQTCARLASKHKARSFEF